MRNGENKRSALDHIYHSPDKISKNYKKLKNYLSDHPPIMCSIQLLQERKKIQEKYILRRSFANFNEQNWLLDLMNQPWEKVIDPYKNVHQIAQEFGDIYESTFNRYAPLRKTKIRPHYQKGLSKKTLQLIRERDKLGAERNRTKNPHMRQALNKALKKKRNAVTSRVRKEKKLAVIDKKRKW